MILLIILSLNDVDQKSNAVLTAAHCVRHFTQTPGDDVDDRFDCHDHHHDVDYIDHIYHIYIDHIDCMH